MDNTVQMSRHARHRAEQRIFPSPVIEMILEYGESLDAGEGAQKFALSKSSLRTLRKDLGARSLRALHRYRNAYVVASKGRVVTVAFSRRPLFH